jgi:hypothetical protein
MNEIQQFKIEYLHSEEDEKLIRMMDNLTPGLLKNVILVRGYEKLSSLAALLKLGVLKEV